MKYIKPLPSFLINRYHGWRATQFQENKAWYARLADDGQNPRTMVITCCDSRMHVTSVFGAETGEFFIHRNIANLVPKFSPDGKKKISPLADTTSAQKAQASIKRGEWNTYRIVADGHTLTHQINGHIVSKTEDKDPKKRASKGLLAFQMHQGPAMKVQYKNVRMLELPDSPSSKAGSPPAKKAANTPDASQTIKSLPGFRVTEIHAVDKKTEGSWTAMCFDDQGQLYVCDQYGKLYRITLKNGKIANKVALDSPGKAQGLCWRGPSSCSATT